jgi:hypothetical protein
LGLKTIKEDMINWLKKIAYNQNLVDNEYIGHCPNFATRCCLTCDRCWKDYQETK